jgi:hypothetical protein
MANKFFTTIFDFIASWRRNASASTSQSNVFSDDPIGVYDVLETLYDNDTPLYAGDTTRRLRTVVNRSVEFYTSKMIPGDKITISPTNKKPELTEAIQTVLRTSNFQANKPAMLRYLSLFGDQFTRVRGTEEKVLLENLKPRYVTDFTEDSRGFLQTIRIDIPTTDQYDNPITYTEYWDMDGYRSWNHNLSSSEPIENLGTPLVSVTLSELGTDFIPIVHTKFKNTGNLRGQSCVYHALDKIYEANRLATRLNDLQFRHNKPVWAVTANDKDGDGRPLPPPSLRTSGTGANATEAQKDKEFVLGDIVSLPGMSKIDSLIPGINYEHALRVVDAQMVELQEDLPELRYYSIRDNQQLSGEAIQRLLGAAVDRALEARNNFTESLKRMNMMALTIGVFLGQFPVTLGSFDNGDFEHDIIIDQMFGETISTRSTTFKTLTDGGMPMVTAMHKTGFSDEEIAEATEEKNKERQIRNDDLANSLLSFNRGN